MAGGSGGARGLTYTRLVSSGCAWSLAGRHVGVDGIPSRCVETFTLSGEGLEGTGAAGDLIERAGDRVIPSIGCDAEQAAILADWTICPTCGIVGIIIVGVDYAVTVGITRLMGVEDVACTVAVYVLVGIGDVRTSIEIHLVRIQLRLGRIVEFARLRAPAAQRIIGQQRTGRITACRC